MRFQPLAVCACMALAVFWTLVFTALHGMQTRSSDENSVHPSVRLSVKRMLCDKMEERSIQIFISYESSFSLVLWEEEWLVLKFWVNGPRWSKFADFEPIIARSASVVTPSEKSSISTNRKFTHYALSSEPKMIIVHCPQSPPKGGSKTQNGCFPR